MGQVSLAAVRATATYLAGVDNLSQTRALCLMYPLLEV